MQAASALPHGARGFARGRRVLDAACGEGYGAALLSDVATSVLGVDISEVLGGFSGSAWF